MLELSRHPECQEKLRQDINETMSKLRQKRGENFKLDFTDLFHFHYLTSVINETLRLWPVVALGTTVSFFPLIIFIPFI